MKLLIDIEGAHLGEHWIVGGTAPIDITKSSAKAKHVEEFKKQGAAMLLSYAGDIVRQSYPEHFG